MRALIAVPMAVLLPLPGAAWASADPDGATPTAGSYSPPFIDHTAWTQAGQGSSLRVYPTLSGRAAARQSGASASGSADGDEAWAEVLALAPDADTAGMRAQFLCHWDAAELVQPGKVSWNLEPWRPVVDDATMLRTGCNPGGSEESF